MGKIWCVVHERFGSMWFTVESCSSWHCRCNTRITCCHFVLLCCYIDIPVLFHRCCWTTLFKIAFFCTLLTCYFAVNNPNRVDQPAFLFYLVSQDLHINCCGWYSIWEFASTIGETELGLEQMTLGCCIRYIITIIFHQGYQNSFG
jgi:hypothetical protein